MPMNVGGLEIVNVFVQSNMNQAYSILDKRGEVINRWRPDFEGANYGTDYVQFVNQVGRLRVFEVHPNRMWLYFERPDTLTYVSDHSLRLIEGTADIINAQTFTRIGFRVQCVLPVGDLHARIPEIARTLYSTRISDTLEEVGTTRIGSFQASVEIQTGEFVILLNLAPVERVKGAEALGLPQEAIMVDADIHRDEELHLRDIRRSLTESWNWAAGNLQKVARSFLPGGLM